MSTTTYPGINYAGTSQANQDTETGIHYGVIPSRAVSQWTLEDVYQNGEDLGYKAWKEEVQAKVKSAVLEALEDFVRDRHAEQMADDATEAVMDSDWLGENYENNDNTSYLYESDRVKIQLCSDGDIFVLKSPVVCNAQYCSPCAPGAGYLLNPCEDGPVCYCLPEDWFDEENPCPYVSRPVESK